ncbi:hypothetical protein [Microcoleus sp.]|uniref:hypothetical protein n=1 Tax=Microcoleus sp. TaxID=44472 RepID=UPI003594782B
MLAQFACTCSLWLILKHRYPAGNSLDRRKKEEGRGKKEEGRRKKEEGRRNKEEGIRNKSNSFSNLVRCAVHT